ncbi:MAG: hypothetical protein ACREMD_15020 [Gemmatimonadota bacterium]
MRLAAAGLLIGTLLAPAFLRAQADTGTVPPPPPPGGITSTEPGYALGFGVGRLTWDDDAPYGGLTVASVGIERRLWQGIRGRARIGLGETELQGDVVTDVTVVLLDLDLLVAPAFGPLRDWPVLPYVVGGLGAVVTNPAEEAGAELGTESQSQWTLGGGVRARPFRRLELEFEGTRNGVRLLDPLDPENPNRESETIHNLRWEGRVSWIF